MYSSRKVVGFESEGLDPVPSPFFGCAHLPFVLDEMEGGVVVGWCGMPICCCCIVFADKTPIIWYLIHLISRDFRSEPSELHAVLVDLPDILIPSHLSARPFLNMSFPAREPRFTKEIKIRHKSASYTAQKSYQSSRPASFPVALACQTGVPPSPGKSPTSAHHNPLPSISIPSPSYTPTLL